MSQLLINLAFAAEKPTGHTVYAKNILPGLRDLHPIVFSGHDLAGFQCDRISHQFTPEHGSKGHLRRLLWTQFRLPQRYRKLRGTLLFSPIPEVPLFSGVRSIVTLHDVIPLRFPRRTPLTPYFRHYIPQVLHRANHVICNSEATANDAVNFYHVPAQKLTVTPLSYDAEHFRFLNLPTQNYFLYIGRPDAYKNVQRLVAAFAQLIANSAPNNLELWIAGPTDPRYTPKLAAQAAELGIADRVKFLSYVSYADLPIVINQAIALVFPSLWEGFGLPVLEAMACGTPVITSNLSALPEVAGDAAILVDPYRTDAIADAMQHLSQSSALRAELRQKGLARSCQFSWTQTANTTAQLLQQYL